MLLNSLELDTFRLFREISVNFDDGINVITGKNAQGKTTLLEAVYYLSCNRSFKTAGDRELITFGSDRARISGCADSFGREHQIDVVISSTKRREVTVNGVKQKKTSEMPQRLTVVLFNPDDLDIVKDGAVVRRRMMDLCISQLRPRYKAALYEFNRLYEHKTRILKAYREKPSLLELLDDYNYRLAMCSAQLMYYRASFSSVLSEKAKAIHGDFSGGAEQLELRYKTVGGIAAHGKKPSQLLPEILAHQQQHRAAELRAGICLTGAHKDELEIIINGESARKFASQGQARTAAVSIKLAERDIHFEDTGEYPVLLLDDVLSELDSKRQSFLLERIPHGQTLITSCDAGDLKTRGAVMRIEDGRVV